MRLPTLVTQGAVGALLVAGGMSIPAAAAAQGAVGRAAKATTASAPASGRQSGRVAALSLRLQPNGRLRVRARPLGPAGRMTLRVEIVTGHRIGWHEAIGELPPGSAVTRTVALPPIGRRTAGVEAELLSGSRVVQSQFLAAESRGGHLVVAGSYQGLAAAALRGQLARRQLTRAQYGKALSRLNQVPTRARATAGQPAVSQAAASISGTITYQDLAGSQLPVRNAQVGITADGGQTLLATATTSLTGQYTLSFEPAACGSYQVEVLTNDGVGTILNPAGQPYSVLSSPLTPCPGDSLTDIDLAIPEGADSGNAFALLDALYTAGEYYQSISQAGWATSLTVSYPDGSGSEYTDPASRTIYVPGGSTECGKVACPEEGFDWDALAAQTGVVVALNGGFDAASGGMTSICASTWSGSTSKRQAVELAWANGWAAFYGVAALQQEGTPYGIPGVQDGVYADNAPGHSFSYPLSTDPARPCRPAGDASELAIARALWDFYDYTYNSDGGHLQWTLSYLLSQLEAARPTTFTAAYVALTAGQPASPVLETQRTLSALGFAPRVKVKPGKGARPPVINWSPGGSAAHPLGGFTVQFIDDASNAVIYRHSTGQMSLRLSSSAWRTIRRHSAVSVQVTGSQGTAPVSGPFTSSPITVPTSSKPPRILIMGDSISNGLEGSYTWRYRLWQHFADANVPVQFVGHRLGTEDIYDNPTDEAVINGTPPPANGFDADPTDGSYLAGGFEQSGQSAHDSVWGWRLALAMTEVKQQVVTYHPDYLLVELGYNDLAYQVSTPAQTIANMGTLIANARAADPHLKIVIADVVQHAPGPAFTNLNAEISSYDAGLATAIPGWSTTESPAVEADIASSYDASTQSWDGLHPNGVGEYVIAAAFESALHDSFGLGPAATPVPSSVPDVSMYTPPYVTAAAVPQGVLLQWGHTYGASGYEVYSRDVTAGQTSFTELAEPVVGDHWYDRWVLAGHVYQYYVTAVRGNSPPSAPTATVSATANPLTLPGPQDLAVYPASGAGANSITVSWSPTPGDNGNYQVEWTDLTAGSTDSGTATASGTGYTITGLTDGNIYQVIVASENQYGSGYPSGALPAHVGYGTPSPAPTMTSAQQIDASDAQIEWTPAAGETGDWMYQSTDAGQTFSELPFPITPQTDPATGDNEWIAGLLTSPVTNYEYYVVSCNGSDCTAPAAPITVTPLSGAGIRLSPAQRERIGNMRDPSRLYYHEGLGQPALSPDPR